MAEHLNISSNLAIGDDVERIRIARNVLVHKIKAEISEEDMEDFFTKFLDVAKRVDQWTNGQIIME
jgi:RNA recognition motif-containing protein